MSMSDISMGEDWNDIDIPLMDHWLADKNDHEVIDKKKVICCGDVVDFDFKARGQTEEEVLQKFAQHAQTEHGMKEIPKELVEKVR
jgi:predicted small metal-binding protein